MLWAIACYQKRGARRPPCCHFIPSCSEYARIAIEKHGAAKGGWLAVRRILRCHPFTRREPYDPVP
ncbi:MAG: membrane protein insertion efficiency factor YidD [Clostridia bacterium]|nr:membrane protein insertion efficiency factor YidD [Clostridia bacterium]